jgi:hypothetical protein
MQVGYEDRTMTRAKHHLFSKHFNEKDILA